MTENEQLREENRRLWEALEPFKVLAERFAVKTETCEGIEGDDRIRVEYSWAEFRSFIRVRDLRAALAPAVAQEKENAK